jgi:hypothetical protein
LACASEAHAGGATRAKLIWALVSYLAANNISGENHGPLLPLGDGRFGRLHPLVDRWLKGKQNGGEESPCEFLSWEKIAGARE